MRECDGGVDEDIHSHAAYRWSCSITSSHTSRIQFLLRATSQQEYMECQSACCLIHP